MEIRNVLFATDFSECAAKAQETAFDVAERFGAKIHIVHALEVPLPIFEPYAVAVPDRFLAEAREGAGAKLDAVMEAARGRGLDGTSALGEVPAAFAIKERAADIDADLVVVGTEGHTGLRHVFLGSVAEGVVRTAGCSVLTARGSIDDGDGPIVVGADFSEAGERAVAAACELAETLGRSLHLVHSAPTTPPMVGPYEVAVPIDFHDAVIREAKSKLEAVAAECEIRGQVTCEVSPVPAHVAIPEIADKLGAPLVVVGSRGLTGLKHLVLGSVAERTVRHAPCSVWIVRDDG